MKKIFLAVMLPFFLAGALQAKKINIVTTTTDLASIAKAVGGDNVSVVARAKPPLCRCQTFFGA
jgi:ABC-type Zn uptake system ZnuABC Zn-binding protein ZnuA